MENHKGISVFAQCTEPGEGEYGHHVPCVTDRVREQFLLLRQMQEAPSHTLFLIRGMPSVLIHTIRTVQNQCLGSPYEREPPSLALAHATTEHLCFYLHSYRLASTLYELKDIIG